MSQDVTNPGTVSVADQGDGLLVVDQPVTTGPSSSSGPLAAASDLAPGLGTASPDQPITVGAPQVAGLTVDGGLSSPQSPSTLNVIANNVVGQVYGTGTPATVYA